MRIAITGSHNTGKTSLINKLYPRIEFEGYDFYQEAVREVYRLGFPFNNESNDSSQLAMSSLHLLHFPSDVHWEQVDIEHNWHSLLER